MATTSEPGMVSVKATSSSQREEKGGYNNEEVIKKYVRSEGKWPPEIVDSNAPYYCPEAQSNDQLVIQEKEINNNIYCIYLRKNNNRFLYEYVRMYAQNIRSTNFVIAFENCDVLQNNDKENCLLKKVETIDSLPNAIDTFFSISDMIGGPRYGNVKLVEEEYSCVIRNQEGVPEENLGRRYISEETVGSRKYCIETYYDVAMGSSYFTKIARTKYGSGIAEITAMISTSSCYVRDLDRVLFEKCNKDAKERSDIFKARVNQYFDAVMMLW